ncbi:hypothetical protein BC937DRAFT_93868 [Endogone sp. FLAS-F59071]|nr:hypothetical protein BC937DRAFT_93868 [Endogone sp. FLAS-F59071]|eukprot:RUS14414.1 hypothetical protein BC937DRAFT_93868 [Endogone sp. FLAS-F59071]
MLTKNIYSKLPYVGAQLLKIRPSLASLASLAGVPHLSLACVYKCRVLTRNELAPRDSWEAGGKRRGMWLASRLTGLSAQRSKNPNTSVGTFYFSSHPHPFRPQPKDRSSYYVLQQAVMANLVMNEIEIAFTKAIPRPIKTAYQLYHAIFRTCPAQNSRLAMRRVLHNALYFSSTHSFSLRTCSSSSGVKSLTILKVLRISSGDLPLIMLATVLQVRSRRGLISR